jgi:hypothetical protein
VDAGVGGKVPDYLVERCPGEPFVAGGGEAREAGGLTLLPGDWYSVCTDQMG